MKTLKHVTPTDEQRSLLHEVLPGVTVIHGAAGSGKTTAALLRLQHLGEAWRERKRASGHDDTVRALVLVFNRTLMGYVNALTYDHIDPEPWLNLEVSTFGGWAKRLVGDHVNVRQQPCDAKLRQLSRELDDRDRDFIFDEAQHVLGRFDPKDYDQYHEALRPGRGAMPHVDYARRQLLIRKVVEPYRQWKADTGMADWNDVATGARVVTAEPWDVVVIDEAQDLSAVALRAVMSHVAADHHVTLIMDSAQRIYPASMLFSEVQVTPAAVHALNHNYRNTRQIARLARPFVEGLDLVDPEAGADGKLPDLNQADRDGAIPVVVVGSIREQIQWALDNVVAPAVDRDETVAFLSPRNGVALEQIRATLDAEEVSYTELTQRAEWPSYSVNVAISTLHSAKGLEFDHVVICGLHRDVTPHGIAHNDSRLETLRRLMAMGIGRARETVTIGYEQAAASSLIQYLDKDAYRLVDLSATH
jgi:superfamily I DNA/RNA helicase